MKPILRNFLSVIRRYKLALSLNILGLSVAFAAFMVIIVQVNYDLGFDKCHKDYDRIFRVEISFPSISMSRVPILSRPLAERFIESSPYIVAGALTNPLGAMFGGGEAYFHVEADDARNYFKEKLLVVTPEFFNVFSFDFVEGSTDVYIAPGNVFIPLSMARKIFRGESAVGKQIVHGSWGNQTVLGVYRDFPANSSIENIMYFAMQPDENKDNWGNFNYNVFIRVNDASNAPLIIENFMRTFDFATAFTFDGFGLDTSGIEMYLTSLPDVHFLQDIQYDFAPKASKQTLMILFVIALVIIAIAAINFTNFSTALTPMRIKNINTQRVLGARRSLLRGAIASEAVAVGFLAYLVALIFVDLFNKTTLAMLVDADLSFSAQSLIFGGTALVALLTGLLAGLYPAFYMTSFAPALVLKGSFGLSPKGRKLRNTLIGIQFVASFALIIGASFMYLQNRFMQNSPLGYERDNLITVDVGRIYGSRDAFTNQIKAYSGIDEVTYGQFLISSSDAYMKWGRMYKGNQITFMVLPVHYTFLQTMGIKIIEGRDFRQEDANTEQGVWVFNESARKEFDLELNTTIDGGSEIIGFMPDVKFASFRMAVEPMAFYLMPAQWNNQTRIAYIKLNAGTSMRSALSHINATLAEFDADYPFEIRFFDEVLQRLYEKETALSSLISLFSLLAIIISIVGVFGLVVFDSESRRKEIGIRKVLGASTIGIIIMFNKVYFRILVVCFFIAAPLAWYAVNRWLQNFAYKTPMYWWVYLLAFIVVAAITVCTVTFQNWRVANDDPVKAIKSGG